MFLPVNASLPLVHSDFAQPIPLAFDSVSHMQSATAEKVEERWQSMNLQLNCVISNWEHSGQGDGGFIAGDDDLPEEEEGENNDDDSEEIMLYTNLAPQRIIPKKHLICKNILLMVKVFISFTFGKCLNNMICLHLSSNI